MRKNKTGGRKVFNQTIIEAPKKKDGTINPNAGKKKTVTHSFAPKTNYHP